MILDPAFYVHFLVVSWTYIQLPGVEHSNDPLNNRAIVTCIYCIVSLHLALRELCVFHFVRASQPQPYTLGAIIISIWLMRKQSLCDWVIWWGSQSLRWWSQAVLNWTQVIHFETLWSQLLPHAPQGFSAGPADWAQLTNESLWIISLNHSLWTKL